MMAMAFFRTTLDGALPSAKTSCLASSLPTAGFCVYRASPSPFAIGIFTTHRADPSWT